MSKPTEEQKYFTDSGIEIKRVYPKQDIPDEQPGAFPFTRGVHPDMYRSKLWTMRQYAGFSTAEESNKRYHYLLNNGTTGLSVAFDLPTQMGYDSDHELSEGEVGKSGVAIDTLRDMEILFDGIELEDIIHIYDYQFYSIYITGYVYCPCQKTRSRYKKDIRYNTE